MREQEPKLGISELQQKLGKIDQSLGKANRVSQSIGNPEFGRPELDISPSSQLDGNAYLNAALRVGRVRKAVTENAIPKLTDLKGQAQIQINDLKAQNEREEKLQQIRELVDAGYIPETVLERTQETVVSQKEVAIDEFDLPTRIHNVLSRGGIKTLGQLLQSSRKDLLLLRNMGTKTMEAIEEKLKEKEIALAKEDEPFPNTEAKDRDGKPVRKSSRQPILTDEFIQKLRDEFLGRLPDNLPLKVLHYYREGEQALLTEQGLTQIDGWMEYLGTLDTKQVARISFVIGAATRAGIETAGDVRQLNLERLSPNKGIGNRSLQFLIQAFEKTTVAGDTGKESSLAIGKATEAPPKEAEIDKTSRMLQVEKALGIDMATYLKEEYETRGRSIEDIVQDIRDKTNGEIRTSTGTVRGWLKNCGINTRSVSEASKLLWQDPLKREAIRVARNTPEAKRKKSEALKRRIASHPDLFLASLEKGRRVFAQMRYDATQATLKTKFGDNPKEALENLYVTQGFSIQRVAEKCGVPRRTISGWFKILEITQQTVVLKPEAIDIFNRAGVSDYLTTLNPRERQVLEDRYNKDKTLDGIGAELGITRERVRQIESKALSKLRSQLNSLG